MVPLIQNYAKRTLVVGFLLLTLGAAVILAVRARAFGCGSEDASNANGSLHITYNCNLCTDPSSGLEVEWVTYGPPIWTTNDQVQHVFDVFTVSDPDNICRTDTPSASGSSTDGQFTIQLNSYTDATIWDHNGVQVYP